MIKTPGLVFLLALVAYFDTAFANVVKLTPSGASAPQKGFKTGFCYANFESDSDKVKSFYKYECVGAGSTIYKNHYSDVYCQNQICQESVADGATISGTVVTCAPGDPDVAVGLLDKGSDTCRMDANQGCGMTATPNLIDYCLTGQDYWKPDSGGQQIYSSYYSSKFQRITSHQSEIGVTVYDCDDCNCAARQDGGATYRLTTTDGIPGVPSAGDRGVNCMVNGYEAGYGIPSCNSNGAAGSWFYTTQTDAMAKASFEMSDTPYVCTITSASSSASSLVASSLAALLAVAAAPLFL